MRLPDGIVVCDVCEAAFDVKHFQIITAEGVADVDLCPVHAAGVHYAYKCGRHRATEQQRQ